MTKAVEVYSDGICYWWRWLAIFIGFAVFYWMGRHLQGEAHTPVFDALLGGFSLGALILAYVHRPRSYRVILQDSQLTVERFPHPRRPSSFDVREIRYVTVRQTGHFFNLSALSIVVRTRNGSFFFGPIYKNGVDTIASSEVARLLPRLQRPVPAKSS